MNSTISATSIPHEDSCLLDRKWSHYLISIVATFGVCIFMTYLYRVVEYFYYKIRNVTEGSHAPYPEKNVKINYFTKYRIIAQSYISGQTTKGRIFISFTWFLNIASLTIYWIDEYRSNHRPEMCHKFRSDRVQQVDMTFHVYFLFFTITKFLAAENKMHFWFEMHSIIDFVTMPPFVLSIYYDRQWLGFRFMRILWIITLPDILKYMNILKNSLSIKASHLLANLVALWLSSAGFVHLLETTGDFFKNYENRQEMTYWDSVYFLVITMSTVGYGDISCQTQLGRAFCMIFIIVSMYLFASNLQSLNLLTRPDALFSKKYHKAVGIKHLVVAGTLTFNSVNYFVEELLNKNRKFVNTICVFINEKPLDLQTDALFRKYFTHIKFFIGDATEALDLQRVALETAQAFVIITDIFEETDQDSSNILKAIAAKNYCPDTRIIIQLKSFIKKGQLQNTKKLSRNDQIICEDEIKFAFLAKSCHVHGFSTLIMNFFLCETDETGNEFIKHLKKKPEWLSSFLRGEQMMIYTSKFSKYFDGLTLSEAILTCYTNLNLLLIGMKYYTLEDNPLFTFNAGNKVDTIDDSTLGIFLCKTQDELILVENFCKICQATNIKRKCVCADVELNYVPNTPNSASAKFDINFNDVNNGEFSYRHSSCKTLQLDDIRPRSASVNSLISMKRNISTENEKNLYDFTGTFHYCPSRSFEGSFLHGSKMTKELENHVVLLVLADETSQLVGLCNFVMPLRASYYDKSELRKIIIVGNETYLRKEWPNLKNFPDVYIKIGSPLQNSVLRSLKLNFCSMCVITEGNVKNHNILNDCNCISCCLTIESMTFNKFSDIWRTKFNQREKIDYDLNEKLKKLKKLKQQTQNDENSTNHSKLKSFRSHIDSDRQDIILRKRDVRTITDLSSENSYHLLNIRKSLFNIPFRLSLPYATGSVFTSCLLKAIVGSAYFSQDIMSILRMLLIGTDKHDFDNLMAGEMGLYGSSDKRRSCECQLELYPVQSRYFYNFIGNCYRELFEESLKRYGIICIGLYRKLNALESHGLSDRYVITNPVKHLELVPSDQIFCFIPSE